MRMSYREVGTATCTCRRQLILAAVAVCLAAAPAAGQTSTPAVQQPAAPVSLAAAHAAAAPLLDATADILDARVQGFFANLAKEDVPAARVLDDLLAGGPLAGSPDRSSILESIRQFDQRYGKFVESELISTRSLGDDVVIMHYLYKGRTFPVVWHFTFYRDFQRLSAGESYDRWVVIGVRFDTDLEALETYGYPR